MVDESHVTLPQVRGMYNGDRARKQNLVDYGFRLPSALDNRPLKYDEFEGLIPQAIYVSATPGEEETTKSTRVVDQLIRPTGLLDPLVEVRPTKHQIDDLLSEIRKTIAKKERVLITTLTKKMAEDLTAYLEDVDIKVTYLHSDIDTLERMEILRDLRMGKHDVLVGINLLREGLDLPEVSLIAILDADKEGFLRSDTSLIQTIGRAARNEEGRVIMYADNITGSMQRALDETNRRREIQQNYNEEHDITPKTIVKSIHELISTGIAAEELEAYDGIDDEFREKDNFSMDDIEKIIINMEVEMRKSAEELDFERAAVLRDQIKEMREQYSIY